jgi:glycosyltransferase involved in cell wall biosynthesis
MSNVVLKIWPFWPKGIKYHDQYLAEAMVEDGVSTFFAYPNIEDPNYQQFVASDERLDDFSASSLHLKFITLFGKAVPYNFLWFARQIVKINPGVIHIFGISNFTTFFVLLAAKIAAFNGKFVINDHSDPNERKNGPLAVVYRFIFRCGYHLFIRNRFTVIVPDDSAREELVFRYGKGIAKKIKIFPLGYDSNIFYYKPGTRTASLPLIIGFAGKIFPQKRLDLLIDVVRQFPKDSIIVNIAGLNSAAPTEYQQSLINLANKTCDNIHFFRFIPSPKLLAQFYSSVDIAVYPGSISITTFEANGCGCPVVVYESVKGLSNRVSHNRGELFQTREQLVEILGAYVQRKADCSIDFSSIAMESKRYSWQRLKYLYYQEYDFSEELSDA